MKKYTWVHRLFNRYPSCGTCKWFKVSDSLKTERLALYDASKSSKS